MDENQNKLYQRFASEIIATALEDTPVVLVTGPRQCGKTTLVQNLVSGNREFLTLDDDTVLAAGRSDPAGLVRGLEMSTIDEIQRAPDLLRAIKRSVDEDRRAGRFLLTGSANLLTVPKVSESLAGRMEIVNLLPLSQAEIYGVRPVFMKAAFQGKLGKPGKSLIGKALVEAVLTGGLSRDVAARTTAEASGMGARLHPRHCAERCARYCRDRKTGSDAEPTPGACSTLRSTYQFQSDGWPDWF